MLFERRVRDLRAVGDHRARHRRPSVWRVAARSGMVRSSHGTTPRRVPAADNIAGWSH